MRKTAGFLTIIFFLILITGTLSGIAIVYPIKSTTTEYAPPVVLNATQTNTTLGANQTSGTVVLYVTNNTYDAAPPGTFADGWGGWFVATNDATAFSFYWVNDTPANGYILIYASSSVASGDYGAVLGNLTFPSLDISSITLSFDYAYAYSITGFSIFYPELVVGVYDYNTSTATTLYSTYLTANTTWTPVSTAVTWTPTPGDKYAIFVELYVSLYISLFGGLNFAALGIDNITLTVTTTNYVLSYTPALGVDDLDGIYNVSISACNVTGVGTANATIVLRNGAYISTPVEIVNNTITAPASTEILFNSSNTLLKNGTIQITASLLANTTVSILLELTYRANGVIVTYREINITLVSP